MTRTEQIEDLKSRTERIIEGAKKFDELGTEVLNQRETPERWSVLECLEHLNYYGDFYLPEISKRIERAVPSENENSQSGWLGNYFALTMLPAEDGKLKKMNTFKSMNPIHKKLGKDVVVKFLKQQEEMLRLLDKAKRVDLSKTKTATSISKFIKLRLVDTLRVVIYHNQRHLKQAEQVIKSMERPVVM